MTQFRSIDGKVLDPQPTIDEVHRERLEYAQAVLLTNDSEKIKHALSLLTEIDQLMVDNMGLITIAQITKYVDESPEIDRMIDWPRDLFSMLLRKGCPYMFYMFEWVDFHKTARKLRLKMLHDVIDKNGKEWYNLRPNGDHFGHIQEDNVVMVRLSKNYGWDDKDWKHPFDRVPGDDHYRELRSTL